MNLFELRNVTCVLGDRTVLDLPALDLEEGRTYSLQGPNGSGKSTFLHILALLLRPASGVMRYASRQVIWEERILRDLRKSIVLLEQNPILFSTTVLKNVEFGPRMRGMDAKARQSLALQCLDLVGLQNFADRPAHALSGGETQRTAIARALACKPRVLLMDEPTASVDVEHQLVIENVIRAIRQERNLTIVFSTHDQLQAARLAEKHIHLFQGKMTDSSMGNHFMARIERKNGRTFCWLQESVAVEIEDAPSGPVRISIAPAFVRVFSVHTGGPSSNGVFPGRLLQTAVHGEEVQLHLDIGIQVCALMSRQQCRELGAQAGDDVLVGFKPGAVRVVEKASD